MKHFGLEILVIRRILEYADLFIFKYIFWYKCMKMKKEKKFKLFTKIWEIYQVSQRFQYSQIVYIKTITQ